MNHIVVDFEFAKTDKKNRKISNYLYEEIVEFGAVKLDDNYNVIDKFQTYVKPQYTSKISQALTNLTGITYDMLENAQSFENVTNDFINWIGDDNFKIYAWSENDKAQFDKETFSKGIAQNILNSKKWVDIQKIYIDVVGLSKSIKLEYALNSLGLNIEGTLHRACDDALNTASILQTIKDRQSFNETVKPLRDVFNTPSSSSSLGELFADKLTQLYALCEA